MNETNNTPPIAFFQLLVDLTIRSTLRFSITHLHVGQFVDATHRCHITQTLQRQRPSFSLLSLTHSTPTTRNAMASSSPNCSQ